MLFDEDAVLAISTQAQTTVTSSTASQCTASYGSEAVCCDQPDTEMDQKGQVRACPRDVPYCEGYVANRQMGVCVNAPADLTCYGYKWTTVLFCDECNGCPCCVQHAATDVCPAGWRPSSATIHAQAHCSAHSKYAAHKILCLCALYRSRVTLRCTRYPWTHKISCIQNMGMSMCDMVLYHGIVSKGCMRYVCYGRYVCCHAHRVSVL